MKAYLLDIICVATMFMVLATSCSKKEVSINYKSISNTDFDKVQLFKINGNNADLLGTFELGVDSVFSIKLDKIDMGIYKIIKRRQFQNQGIIFIAEAGMSELSIVESNNQIVSSGSEETALLYEMLNFINSCDSDYEKIRMEMLKGGVTPATLASYEKELNNTASECTNQLKEKIESLPNKLASLYALDYLGGSASNSLIESVICKTVDEYGVLYLHDEILNRLGKEKASYSCLN